MTPITLPDTTPKTPFEQWLRAQGIDRYPNFSRRDMYAAFEAGMAYHKSLEEPQECKMPSKRQK